ncbi:MAG: hypothetical protein DRP47_11675, partial [Candidatus Zixiibacteriota bacterium]
IDQFYFAAQREEDLTPDRSAQEHQDEYGYRSVKSSGHGSKSWGEEIVVKMDLKGTTFSLIIWSDY